MKIKATELKKLETKLNEYMIAFGLRNWIIRINPEIKENDNEDEKIFAETDIREDIQEADITFGRKFFNICELEQEQTIIHELLHIKLENIICFYQEQLKALSVLVEGLTKKVEEQTVNDLATSIINIKGEK